MSNYHTDIPILLFNMWNASGLRIWPLLKIEILDAQKDLELIADDFSEKWTKQEFLES